MSTTQRAQPRPPTQMLSYASRRRHCGRLRRLLHHGHLSDLDVHTRDPPNTTLSPSLPRSFRVHRGILAAASDQFLSLLSNCGPSTSLSDVSTASFALILEYCYTGEVVALLPCVVVDGLLACEKYGLTELRALLERCLPRALTLENACDVMRIALASEASRLSAYAAAFVARHFDAVSGTPGFCRLPKLALATLLRSDDLALRNEETVFRALLRWGLSNPPAPGSQPTEGEVGWVGAAASATKGGAEATSSALSSSSPFVFPFPLLLGGAAASSSSGSSHALIKGRDFSSLSPLARSLSGLTPLLRLPHLGNDTLRSGVLASIVPPHAIVEALFEKLSVAEAGARGAVGAGGAPQTPCRRYQEAVSASAPYSAAAGSSAVAGATALRFEAVLGDLWVEPIGTHSDNCSSSVERGGWQLYNACRSARWVPPIPSSGGEGEAAALPCTLLRISPPLPLASAWEPLHSNGSDGAASRCISWEAVIEDSHSLFDADLNVEAESAAPAELALPPSPSVSQLLSASILLFALVPSAIVAVLQRPSSGGAASGAGEVSSGPEISGLVERHAVWAASNTGHIFGCVRGDVDTAGSLQRMGGGVPFGVSSYIYIRARKEGAEGIQGEEGSESTGGVGSTIAVSLCTWCSRPPPPSDADNDVTPAGTDAALAADAAIGGLWGGGGDITPGDGAPPRSSDLAPPRPSPDSGLDPWGDAAPSFQTSWLVDGGPHARAGRSFARVSCGEGEGSSPIGEEEGALTLVVLFRPMAANDSAAITLVPRRGP